MVGYAPLQFVEATSWDFCSAAQVTARLDQDNVAQWTGTVGSMQTGHTGTGQCIRAPSALHRKFTANRFDTVYPRFFFRTSLAAAGQVIVDVRNSGGTLCFLGIDASGNLIVDSGFNTWTDTGNTLTDNTWYQIEFMVRLDAADGAFEVRVNGVRQDNLTRSGVDTANGGVPDRVAFDNSVGDFDDFTLKVGFAGWTDSDWIGRVDGYPKITTLYPNADGALAAWTPSTGTDLYAVVDEVPASTTDFISSNVASQAASFRLTSLPATAATVHFVKQVAYSRANGSESMRALTLYAAGQLIIQHRATNATMNTTWTFREREWPRNERQGQQWKTDAFPTLEVGYRRITTPSTNIDIAQIAVEVLWSIADSTQEQYQVPTLLSGGTHRLAKCWRVTRTDGLVLKYAAHDQPIVIGNDTYESVGGMYPTTVRKESALKESNQDFRGILTSDGITDDDLRAGRYRNAMVEEFCVDWLEPWAGRYYLHRFWVGETRWNGQVWDAQIDGPTRFLQQEIGQTWGRMCRYQFGEPKCFYALHGETYRAVKVASVSDPRRIFRADTADITTSLANSYFAEGRLHWRAGANSGIWSTVRKYTHSTREFELYESVPFDITTADYFDVSPGCNRLSTTCLNTWGNYDNFGGEPHMPGTDKMLSTPDQ